MAGSISTRPAAGPAAENRTTIAADQLPLAELGGAIERSAALFRAELEALDDTPVTLARGPWPLPAAPLLPARPDPSTMAVAASPRAAPPPGRTRSRGRRWRAVLPLISLLGRLAVAPFSRLHPSPPRRSIAAPATPPAPASVPQPPAVASGAHAPVATPTPGGEPPPASAPTPRPAAAASPVLAAATRLASLPPAATTPAPAAPSPAPAAEAALRSGAFEVAIDEGRGGHSAVVVQFDLGDAGRDHDRSRR